MTTRNLPTADGADRLSAGSASMARCAKCKRRRLCRLREVPVDDVFGGTEPKWFCAQCEASE